MKNLFIIFLVSLLFGCGNNSQIPSTTEVQTQIKNKEYAPIQNSSTKHLVVVSNSNKPIYAVQCTIHVSDAIPKDIGEEYKVTPLFPMIVESSFDGADITIGCMTTEGFPANTPFLEIETTGTIKKYKAVDSSGSNTEPNPDLLVEFEEN